MANYDMILNVGHGEDTFPNTGSKGIAVNGQRQKKYAEHTANVEVGKRVAKILDDHSVKYLLTQPFNGKDVPLTTRVSKANATNAKLYLSIHMNAGPSAAKGVCAFYHGYGSTGTANGKKTDAYVKYAKEEGLDLYHGGKWGSEKGKWMDFYETRMPKMFSVITENGFMTNKEDFERIFHNKDNYYDRVARVNAKFALDVLGIKYKGDTKQEDAKKEDAAKKEGVKVQDDLYRVRKSAKDAKTQKGAFTNLNSAKAMADDHYGYQVYDQDGKLVYKPSFIYTVKKGDTLGEIASKYKTTVKKLQDDNGIKKANLIYPGQKIKIK